MLNVNGARPAAVITLPRIVTGRPSALKFSVSLPSPPSTVIGVEAEGVIVNVSSWVLPSIEADGAISVPSTTTFAPAVSAELWSAEMVIVPLAWIVEPVGTVTLSPAWSVTDEVVDWINTPGSTVRSSPVPGDSAADRTMALADVTFAAIVMGLPELIVTVPAPVVLIGPVTVIPSPAAASPLLEMSTLPPLKLETPVISSAAGVPAVLLITMSPLPVLVALSVPTRVSRGLPTVPMPLTAVIVRPVATTFGVLAGAPLVMAPVEISVTLPVAWISPRAVSPTTCK